MNDITKRGLQQALISLCDRINDSEYTNGLRLKELEKLEVPPCDDEYAQYRAADLRELIKRNDGRIEECKAALEFLNKRIR